MQKTLYPQITASDRLGMTLFFAILFHGIVILGVTFIAAPSASNMTPSLDVILVNTHNPSEPDQADYLAQVSQDGGGNSDKKVRPTDLFTAPTLSPQPGIAMMESVLQKQHIQHSKEREILTVHQADYKMEAQKKNHKPDKYSLPQPNQQSNALPARLVEELSMTYEAFAQKPKEKFLSSRTREYVAAGYMRGWVDKVERLGNADYPDDAIRNKLSGTLILDVAINSDGSLHKMELRQSSGHQILDDAAKRIVRMSAPFDAFPKKLRQQADIIHITRSWEFLSNNELRSY
ncbi:MAG TPA: TonB family protein [Gammaproteobacteria bacterium]|nr:TonB family protein [Gammaproteobacteria bacterium]